LPVILPVNFPDITLVIYSKNTTTAYEYTEPETVIFKTYSIGFTITFMELFFILKITN